MNIFIHELKQNKVATIIWTAALLAIAALYISIYPSISNIDVSKVMKQFPEAFKKTFGMTEDSLSTFPALYSMILNFVILTGAIQAMNLGVNIISKEVRNKTADFLLSKPVKRFNVLTQKLLSATTLLVITNIVFLAMVWGLIQIFIDSHFKFEVFIKSSLTLFLVQVFFLSLGFLLGIVLPKIKSVIAISLPTVFGFYIFGLLDTVIGKEKIKYLTPFKFFDLNKLALGGTYQTGLLIYLGILVALFITGSYIVYQKKDIHTV
jgi:ABC-2 type transport system permease protein